MTVRRAGAVAVAIALVTLPAYPVSARAPLTAGPVASAACTIKQGHPLTEPPWPDTRLGFRRAWPITQGQGVRVAVIDSGLARTVPVLKDVNYSDPTNVLVPKDKNLYDCANQGTGHGTGVTAIIAGQSAGTPFSGVAPRATIIPIKMTDGDQNANGAAAMATAIRDAVADHAQVANLSVTLSSPDPGVRAAVEDARAHKLILVCASGNDGSGNNLPTYPAAWSGSYDNIIAVSATDQQDSVTQFSESGHYVDLVAPGSSVEVPYPAGGFGLQSGTSFAAPYVTGTVALVLAAHPDLSPGQVRARLEATADPPPQTVPDAQFGYGIVNPYLAVTAVGSTVLAAQPTERAAPLPPLVAEPEADHHLQRVALAVALGLLGLALACAVGVGVFRASRRAPRRGRVPGA